MQQKKAGKRKRRPIEPGFDRTAQEPEAEKTQRKRKAGPAGSARVLPVQMAGTGALAGIFRAQVIVGDVTCPGIVVFKALLALALDLAFQA